MAWVLFNKFIKQNPLNSKWVRAPILFLLQPKRPKINRDRFILSNGHACALQYALLHLTGNPNYSIDDLKQFRQLDSKCVHRLLLSVPLHLIGLLATRRITSPASRSAPVLSVRAFPMPSVSLSPRRTPPPSTTSRYKKGDQRRVLTPAGLPCNRSLHLRVLRRRLPSGGYQLRGGLDCRPSWPWQAHCAVRACLIFDCGLLTRRAAMMTITSPSTVEPILPLLRCV